ncbi:MAG: hypothetical protein AAB425_04430, partial [Bdellovibrionota bacterium]
VRGIPQLIGAQESCVGASRLSFGASFGGAPVQSYLDKKFPLTAIEITHSDDPELGSFYLYPGAAYSLVSASAFVRFFPFSKVSGFFTQLTYSLWIFKANIVMDLRNPTIDTTIPGVVDASVSVRMPMLGLTSGYRYVHPQGFAVELAGGLGFLLKPNHSINIGGMITESKGFSDKSGAIQEQISGWISNEIDHLAKQIRFHPSVFLSVGYVF